MAATSAADGSTWSSMTSTPTTRGRSPPAPAFSGNPTTTATATADTVPATSKETSGASVPAPFHSTGAGRAPGTQPTPLQVLRGSRQLTAHRRQRDVDDRIVHHHQQDAQAQDRQDPPAPAVNIGASRADDAHGPAPAAAVVVTRPQCPAGRTGPRGVPWDCSVPGAAARGRSSQPKPDRQDQARGGDAAVSAAGRTLLVWVSRRLDYRAAVAARRWAPTGSTAGRRQIHRWPPAWPYGCPGRAARCRPRGGKNTFRRLAGRVNRAAAVLQVQQAERRRITSRTREVPVNATPMNTPARNGIT